MIQRAEDGASRVDPRHGELDRKGGGAVQRSATFGGAGGEVRQQIGTTLRHARLGRLRAKTRALDTGVLLRRETHRLTEREADGGVRGYSADLLRRCGTGEEGEQCDEDRDLEAEREQARKRQTVHVRRAGERPERRAAWREERNRAAGRR